MIDFKQFESEVKNTVQQTLGSWTAKHRSLCKKAFNKRMDVSDALSYIILNS